MKRIETSFEGVYLLQCIKACDERGSFTKLFNKEEYVQLGIETQLQEVYYSISQKDVIRGMHFQLPPYDHEKIVHVMNGSVIDVIIDLRKQSSTYKKYLEFQLNEKDNTALYIPKGFAHGFQSLEDHTVMLYQVSTGYHQECDTGIAYDSFGYDWNTTQPIISKRDKEFVSLDDFVSPF